MVPDDYFLHVTGDGERRFRYKNDAGDVDDDLLRQAVIELRGDVGLDKHTRMRVGRKLRRLIIRQVAGKAFGPLEYKMIEPEIHAADQGIVEAYATAFGVVDHGDDIMHKGATERSIAKRFTEKPLLRVLYNHDRDKVLGHPVEVYEDDYGTMTKTQYNLDSFWGSEIFALIKGGDLTAQSVGYLPGEDRPGQKAVTYDDKGIRHLHDIDLFEYGPLPLPMNTGAVVVGVKGIVDHETNFANVVSQAANAVQDVMLEAEDLAVRREADRRSLTSAHLAALEDLRATAEAAVSSLTKVLASGAEASEDADGKQADIPQALRLQLDLARARLRHAGITEVGT